MRKSIPGQSSDHLQPSDKMSSLSGMEDWEETSAMCGENTLKTERITTNQGKKKKMLFFPLLALAATQNYSTPMFGENIENKQTFQEMYSNDSPFLDILLDFIKSEDLTISSDDSPPVDLDELYSMLPTDSTDNLNKTASTLSSLSPTDDFRFPGPQSTQFGYSGLIDKSEIVLDANQENKKNLDSVTSPQPAFSFTPSLITINYEASICEHFNVCTDVAELNRKMKTSDRRTEPAMLTIKASLNTSKETSREASPLCPDTLPIFSQPTSLPEYDLQTILGTNQYQSDQTTVQNNAPPLVSSSPSLSSSSSLDLKASSMSKTTTVMDNYAEMRRKNNLACKLYRGTKKTKQELSDEELKLLEEKNEVLNMKVRQMESIIKDIREKVITDITQPRGNIREFEDDNQTVRKRRRCEP